MESESLQIDRRARADRRRGGGVVAVGAIVLGAALFAAAAVMVPLAAALSAAVIGLVWWSLLRSKPHVRRTQLLATGGGAAVVLWTVVFALPHVLRIFHSDGPARDADGQLLEPSIDLRPTPTEGALEWLDDMAAVGVLAAVGLSLVGYGWRTLRRRRGRRRSGRHAGQEGSPASGEQPAVTPVRPMQAFGAGGTSEREPG